MVPNSNVLKFIGVYALLVMFEIVEKITRSTIQKSLDLYIK
jgi:hypothetical protein